MRALTTATKDPAFNTRTSRSIQSPTSATKAQEMLQIKSLLRGSTMTSLRPYARGLQLVSKEHLQQRRRLAPLMIHAAASAAS